MKILNETELQEYFLETEGITLTEEAAGVLCGYMEGHGYQLWQQDDGTMMRQDTEEEEDVFEEYSVEELLYFVAEWNDELLRDAFERDDEAAYERLKSDERILCAIF